MRVTRTIYKQPTQRTFSGLEPTKKKSAAVKQDRFTVGKTCQDKGTEEISFAASRTAASPAAQEKVERFAELLKQDKAYMNSNSRYFLNNPSGRRLASSMILADESLQDEIAKVMWKNIAEANKRSERNPYLYGEPEYLPPDYRGIDIKGMLQKGNTHTVDQVLIGLDAVLVNKARTVGLTDTERLLGEHYERIEQTTWGTFQERMQPVLKNIEKGFSEAGIPFDREKTYSFHLNTPEFTFTVSGGTDEENALMEQIINTSNYVEDNRRAAIIAFNGHRMENRDYNPWNASEQMEKGELPKTYAGPVASAEMSANMKKFLAAYNRSNTDRLLKKQYGFGVNDIKCVGGKIVGKTDAITEIVKSDDFMKKVGNSFLLTHGHYQGNPEFPDDIFVLENGKFRVLYGESEGVDSMIQGVNSTAPVKAPFTAAKAEQGGSDFRSVLEETSKAVQTAQTSKTSKVPELPDFSKMSDTQKLAELKRLHNETDYSGMTSFEKLHLIGTRVQAAFPYYAMLSGYYGPMVMYTYGTYPNQYHVERTATIPEKVHAEVQRQKKEADIHFPSGMTTASIRRETFYKGMSDDEVFKAVCAKYNSGSRVDFEGLGYELDMLKLNHPTAKTIVDAYNDMRRNRVYPTDILSDHYNDMSLDEIETALWGSASESLSNGWTKITDDLLDDLMNIG